VQVPSDMVRVTLDGQGKARIEAPKGRDSIFIRGRDITVRGFILTGGRDGIHLDQGSVGRIGGNTIEDVPAEGINLTESSNARIGFIIFDPASNTIRNAGVHAIVVSNGSTAKILANTLTGSRGSGIVVTRNAQADIWANVISANAGDAISASHGAGIVLT